MTNISQHFNEIYIITTTRIVMCLSKTNYCMSEVYFLFLIYPQAKNTKNDDDERTIKNQKDIENKKDQKEN